MSAASFWNKAKANYWAGRKQDVYNTYDNATNMGNARSSYNRAATVVGPQRQTLETGYKKDYQTYRQKLADERAAAGYTDPYTKIHYKSYAECLADRLKTQNKNAQYLGLNDAKELDDLLTANVSGKRDYNYSMPSLEELKKLTGG